MDVRNRATWLLIAILLAAPGCFPAPKAPDPAERYVLEYAIPAGQASPSAAGALRIGRFGADPSLDTTQMAYRPAPFRKETDHYNRWIVQPAQLVSGFLLRDFRARGAFVAVFAEGDPQPARFLLQGHLESFEEAEGEGGKGRSAILAATVTMLDLSRKEIPERLLFQKRYRVEEPLPEDAAKGLARAMSRAMARFSDACAADASEAAKRREGESPGL